MPRKVSAIQRAKNNAAKFAAFRDLGLSLEWMRHFSYAPLAKAYADAGFDDPAEARQWANAIGTPELGFGPPEAAEWKAHGFTPEEAAQWIVNWSPQVAAERKRTGYSPRKKTTRTMKTR